MYHHLTSPALKGGGGVLLTPITWGQNRKPPDQLAFVGGSARGEMSDSLLLGALPADAPAEPGASSAAKRAKVIYALREGVHYSGLDRAILTGRTERRHFHPNL